MEDGAWADRSDHDQGSLHPPGRREQRTAASSNTDLESNHPSSQRRNDLCQFAAHLGARAATGSAVDRIGTRQPADWPGLGSRRGALGFWKGFERILGKHIGGGRNGLCLECSKLDPCARPSHSGQEHSRLAVGSAQASASQPTVAWIDGLLLYANIDGDMFLIRPGKQPRILGQWTDTMGSYYGRATVSAYGLCLPRHQGISLLRF
jgi:hypothetical protein